MMKDLKDDLLKEIGFSNQDELTAFLHKLNSFYDGLTEVEKTVLRRNLGTCPEAVHTFNVQVTVAELRDFLKSRSRGPRKPSLVYTEPSNASRPILRSMHIRSVAKHSPADSERVMPAEDMLARASMAAGALGVTRLGNITGLDRLGLPVYTAVVPKSDDTISVYNGKGVRPEDARAGALMEAIERQTALNHDLPVIEASVDELRRGGRAVAGPRSFTHRLCAGFADDLPYLWTEAYDLIGREPVLVPAGLAGYGPKYAASSPFEINSSNGLASGNCFEEAVCHALCELIERDAMTLADLRCRWIPRALREATWAPKPEPKAGMTRAGIRPSTWRTQGIHSLNCWPDSDRPDCARSYAIPRPISASAAPRQPWRTISCRASRWCIVESAPIPMRASRWSAPW